MSERDFVAEAKTPEEYRAGNQSLREPGEGLCHDPEHPDGAYCANTTGLERCHDPAAALAAAPAAPALDVLTRAELIEALRYEIHFDRKHGYPDHFGPEQLADNIFDTSARLSAVRSAGEEDPE